MGKNKSHSNIKKYTRKVKWKSSTYLINAKWFPNKNKQTEISGKN